MIHGAVKLYDYPIWPRTLLETIVTVLGGTSRRSGIAIRTIPRLLQSGLRQPGRRQRPRSMDGRSPRHRRTEGHTPAQLASACGAARRAARNIDTVRTETDESASWLKAEASRRPALRDRQGSVPGTSRNVLLVPLSWEEEVTITKRELARAHASLRLEESQPPDAAARHGRYAGGL